MNIILIGNRGSGKSTVGRRLAARLGMSFLDTDDLIEERQGSSISEIVKLHGWDYFRTIEKRVISDISNCDNLILAAGGGVILEPENVKVMKRNGFIIWLKADVQVLLQRMVKDLRTATGRPTLTGKGALEELEEVIAYRKPFYERASEAQIDASALNIDEVVERVAAIFSTLHFDCVR